MYSAGQEYGWLVMWLVSGVTRLEQITLTWIPLLHKAKLGAIESSHLQLALNETITYSENIDE